MKSISIIIPFHKGLCFLGDLFESILDQNLEEEDYEVICLGDAPEEGIVARIEEYEKRGLPGKICSVDREPGNRIFKK